MENLVEKYPILYWRDATVGFNDKMKDYRDCQDIKLDNFLNPKGPLEVEMTNIWKDLYNDQIGPVDTYCAAHNIDMKYWELMNFIKYSPGHHFQEHADHGYSYVATVSLVGYPNDNYEGGGLYFPKINLEIKPEAGDLYIFPSTYLFSHIARPVLSGTKYSIVTMLDYNDHAHTKEFYDSREKRIKEQKND